MSARTLVGLQRMIGSNTPSTHQLPLVSFQAGLSFLLHSILTILRHMLPLSKVHGQGENAKNLRSRFYNQSAASRLFFPFLVPSASSNAFFGEL